MNVEQKLPKSNHYVPQFYLKGFSQDKESIYRLDKQKAEIKHLPITVVGFQKNLYTFQSNSGKKDSLEYLFSQIEGLAAASIKTLRQGDNLTEQEKADLSMFISSQMVRTPAFKNQLLSSQTEMTKKIMRMSMRITKPENVQDFFVKQGKKMSKEEAEDIIDFGTNEKRSTLRVEYPEGYWLKTMLKLAMDLCPVFQMCDWEIRHSVTQYGFLTSDHPFMLIPGEKPHPFYGVGLLTPKAKKIIPLASDICLIAHEPSDKPTMIHTEANKDFFRKVNKWSTRNAEAYVFSPDGGKVERIAKMNKELLITPKRYLVN